MEAIGAAGFAEPAVAEREIAYMSSPASRHARTETVVSWVADKRHPVKRVPRHEALPEWLVRGEAAVPRTEFVQLQGFATHVHAFILSLVDGRRSLRDIAEVIAKQQLMGRDEAEAAVRGARASGTLYPLWRRGWRLQPAGANTPW